jgi:hypothetical protein
MITGYEAFGIYQALKLHFTQESYDYFKYNGKTNITLSSFENRKDKWHFTKLSKKFSNKDDLVMFLVSNFLNDSNAWIGSLLQEEADDSYKKRLKIIQSLSYTFENDCKVLFEDIKDGNSLLIVQNGDHPILLKKTLQKAIEIETFCILAKILGFLPMWKKKISDTIIWPDFYLKMTKYTCFLPQDVVKYKLLLKKVLND